MNSAPAVLVNGLPGSGKTTLARVAWEHWRCTARPLKLGPGPACWHHRARRRAGRHRLGPGPAALPPPDRL